jgi:D-lyxose ketol-isomerase
VKRSEINGIMQDGANFIRQRGFYLPPFAYWTATEWLSKGEEAREIAENQLGWDITDFGRDDYKKCGLFMFTLRNGSAENVKARKGKLYCEKLMIVDIDQVTPMHFHWNKVEDIINRGGGMLAIQLYNSTEDAGLAATAVTVTTDGVKRVVKASDIILLNPGESITLPSRLYHKFWGVQGRLLVGEVSLVNEDRTDNRFYESVGRFPEIEEDAEPLYLLVTDYHKYYRC